MIDDKISKCTDGNVLIVFSANVSVNAVKGRLEIGRASCRERVSFVV